MLLLKYSFFTTLVVPLQGIAIEAGQFGVTCNAVCPGFVPTPSMLNLYCSGFYILGNSRYHMSTFTIIIDVCNSNSKDYDCVVIQSIV